MQNYLIFHPSHHGLVWAEVTKAGDTTNTILAHIISKMRDGIFTDKGFNLRCVPNIRNKRGQAIKGVWGMPWRQETLKGVEDCEKPGEAVKQALIPGFPNRCMLNS